MTCIHEHWWFVWHAGLTATHHEPTAYRQEYQRHVQWCWSLVFCTGLLGRCMVLLVVVPAWCIRSQYTQNVGNKQHRKKKYIIAEKRSRICSHHLNGLPKIACDEKALSCHLLGVWVCVCDWRPIEFQCIAFQSNWHIAVSSPLSDTRSQIRYNLSFFFCATTYSLTPFVIRHRIYTQPVKMLFHAAQSHEIWVLFMNHKRALALQTILASLMRLETMYSTFLFIFIHEKMAKAPANF